MKNTTTPDIKIISFVAIALIIGFIGGYLFENTNLHPRIDELRQNNTELHANLSNFESMYTDIQNVLALRENELSTAQEEIESLRDNLDLYANDIEMLEEEVTRITELYQHIEYDYNKLSEEYENLTIQPRYKLNEVFLVEDFYLSYNLPTRIYTSPDFTVKGTTTRFDYNIRCEKGLLDPSARIRIYKAGTSMGAYSYDVKLKEEPDSELFYAESSFSVVLEEGKYYFNLIIKNGSLSHAPIYQSNIHIWNYY